MCDVFSEATDIVESTRINLNVIPREIESPYPQVLAFRAQITELTAEMDRRTRKYDTTVAVARQIFAEKLDVIDNIYKGRISKVSEENMAAEKVMEEEIKVLEKTFDQKLHEETVDHIKERDELEAKLVKLRNDFDREKANLTASANAARTRQDMLQKQKEMLEDTHAAVILTVKDKFKQEWDAIASQAAIRTESLEAEIARLKYDIANSETQYNAEMQRMNEELVIMETAQEEEAQAVVNKQLLQFEKDKRAFISEHQVIMSDVAYQMEIADIAAAKEAQVLRAEIDRLKMLLNESDSKFHKALGAIDDELTVELLQRDNEIALAAKMHKKEMKQLKHRHHLKMEKELHDTSKARHIMQQKLDQTRQDGEASRKVLEVEIKALSRAKDKFEQDMKGALAVIARREKERADEIKTKAATWQDKWKKENTAEGGRVKHAVSCIASIAPASLGRKPEIEEELQTRVAKFGDAGKMELAAISKAIDSVDSRFKCEQARLQLGIDDVNRSNERLMKEKQTITDAQKKVQDTIDGMSTQNSQDGDKLGSELNITIAKNHAIVSQLKEDLEKYRESPTKEDISVIQAEHQAEVDEMEQKLLTMQADNKAEMDRIRAEYNEQIENARQEAGSAVSKLNERYDETTESIRKTKHDYKEESTRDHQRWMAARKDMADSNNRIVNAFQNRDPDSAGSALPPL